MKESEHRPGSDAAETDERERPSDNDLKQTVEASESAMAAAERKQDKAAWEAEALKRLLALATQEWRKFAAEGMHPEEALKNILTDVYRDLGTKSLYEQVSVAVMTHKQAHEGCAGDCEELQQLEKNRDTILSVINKGEQNTDTQAANGIDLSGDDSGKSYSGKRLLDRGYL